MGWVRATKTLPLEPPFPLKPPFLPHLLPPCTTPRAPCAMPHLATVRLSDAEWCLQSIFFCLTPVSQGCTARSRPTPRATPAPTSVRDSHIPCMTHPRCTASVSALFVWPLHRSIQTKHNSHEPLASSLSVAGLDFSLPFPPSPIGRDRHLLPEMPPALAYSLSPADDV